MTEKAHQPKKELTQEQLDRVAKIAKWMKTLNGQQVTDVLHATEDQPTDKTTK